MWGMMDGPGPRGNMSAFQDLGLPENATREQISDALWQKQLKDLGLTEDSTLKEYKAALDAKMKTRKEEVDLARIIFDDDICQCGLYWLNNDSSVKDSQSQTITRQALQADEEEIEHNDEVFKKIFIKITTIA